MKRLTCLIAVLPVLTLLLTACGPSASAISASASTVTWSFSQFVATVYQGPDKGFSVKGDLRLQMDATGSITGMVKQQRGSAVNVVGQTNGRAINLVFDLGNQRLLFGVGTLQESLPTCKGAAGGPFVGPRDGDSGGWGTPGKPGGSGD